MALAFGGRVLSNLCTIYGLGNGSVRTSVNLFDVIQTRHYAARKGTREKARKKKVKVEEKKIGFIPHNLRGKDRLKLTLSKKRVDDSWKSVSPDNVWIGKYYKWRVYGFSEAIQCHQETHHPTVYNMPDSYVNVTIELDMQAEKKNRFADNFTRMVSIPHLFDHGEDRTILVFSKDVDHHKSALAAGATMAGGPELIKDIQTGTLSILDYQFVIAHPNILPDLATVRGLMKRKFPNQKSGTLGSDIDQMVLKFKNGIQFSSAKDDVELDFGWVDTAIGKLTMSTQQLEENFIAILKDINSVRPPKTENPFITRVLVKSPPSREKLKLDLQPYAEIINEVKKPSRGKHIVAAEVEDDDDDDEDKKSASAAN